MEHVCSSRKDECLFIDRPNTENFHEILNSNLEQEESPLFSGFPSPFFDDISISAPNKPLNIITKPLPSESKRLIKKRNVGKKDRHSKIHTAQGLRDRRMRLSLHIARKFFDLQDLLGFDKASNTIEWLFSKSNKAIKEVALQNFDQPQLLLPNPNNKNNNQSTSQETICEVLQGLTSEIKSAINKPRENPKKEIKNNKDLRKQIPNNSSTRDQARARARDRTRGRQMIKELEKSKQLFGENTKDEIYKLGLRSPNNHNVEKLGFTSSPLESSPSLEYSSSTANLLQEIQATIDVNSFENYSGSIYNVGGTSTSTYLINHRNPPAAGWLNSTNVGLLGTLGDWEAADRFVSECCNYEIEPTFAADHDPLTAGDIYDQQNYPSAFFM